MKQLSIQQILQNQFVTKKGFISYDLIIYYLYIYQNLSNLRNPMINSMFIKLAKSLNLEINELHSIIFNIVSNSKKIIQISNNYQIKDRILFSLFLVKNIKNCNIENSDCNNIFCYDECFLFLNNFSIQEILYLKEMQFFIMGGLTQSRKIDIYSESNKKNIIINLLVKISKLLTANNIKNWIDFGSLLGSTRNQKFIPWDRDADLCALQKDFNKILNILNYYSKSMGFIFTLITPWKIQIADNNYRKNRGLNNDHTYYKFNIDIFLWAKKGDQYYSMADIIVKNQAHPVPQKYFDKLETTILENNYFNCPSYKEELLQLPIRYGPECINNPENGRQGGAIFRSNFEKKYEKINNYEKNIDNEKINNNYEIKDIDNEIKEFLEKYNFDTNLLNNNNEKNNSYNEILNDIPSNLYNNEKINIDSFVNQIIDENKHNYNLDHTSLINNVVESNIQQTDDVVNEVQQELVVESNIQQTDEIVNEVQAELVVESTIQQTDDVVNEVQTELVVERTIQQTDDVVNDVQQELVVEGTIQQTDDVVNEVQQELVVESTIQQTDDIVNEVQQELIVEGTIQQTELVVNDVQQELVVESTIQQTELVVNDVEPEVVVESTIQQTDESVNEVQTELVVESTIQQTDDVVNEVQAELVVESTIQQTDDVINEVQPELVVESTIQQTDNVINEVQTELVVESTIQQTDDVINEVQSDLVVESTIQQNEELEEDEEEPKIIINSRKRKRNNKKTISI